MILLMTSSGVRIGALCSMQISDLTEVDFQGLKFTRFRFMLVLVISIPLLQLLSVIMLSKII